MSSDSPMLVDTNTMSLDQAIVSDSRSLDTLSPTVDTTSASASVPADVASDGSSNVPVSTDDSSLKKKAKSSKKPKRAIAKSQYTKQKPILRSVLAETYTPVGRIKSWIRDNHSRKICPRISIDAPVQLAACLDYLAADILSNSSDYVASKNRNRITPADILTPLRDDPEAFVLVGDEGLIPNGGVRKMIDPRYRGRAKKSRKSKKSKDSSSSSASKKKVSSSKKKVPAKKASKSSTKKTSSKKKKATTSKTKKSKTSSSKKKSTKKSSK